MSGPAPKARMPPKASLPARSLPYKTPQPPRKVTPAENKVRDPRPSFALPERRHPVRRPLLRLPRKP